MSDYLTRRRERYTKVLNDYPELKEASNLFIIEIYAGSNEQKLQQLITAALICDNPYVFDERNVMKYQLEICDTPTSKNFHSNSPISWELGFMFRCSDSTTIYEIVVERLEQIYFTL